MKESHKKKRVKRYKRIKRLFFTLIAFLVLLVIGGVFLFFHILKINSYELNHDKLYMNTVNDSNMDHYQNIAIFGVDSQENDLEHNTRTDCIIIASINKRTKDVSLVSIYRDTYVYREDNGYGKINAAYAYGGPELAISTINQNFDLNVTDFVTVNFSALTNIIDALDGVEIDIQSDELKEVNKYTNSINKINGTNSPGLTKAGLQTLNGTQATAYCRVRYTSGNDYRRTERQRTVLYAIFDKVKSSNPFTLYQVANEILPQIYTSLSSSDILSMGLSALFYNVKQDTGFPFDQTNGSRNGASVILPTTLSSNVTKLHEYLFGTENYIPSDMVQAITNKIG